MSDKMIWVDEETHVRCKQLAARQEITMRETVKRALDALERELDDEGPCSSIR